LRQAKEIADEFGFGVARSDVRTNLGDLSLREGQHRTAVPLYEESVRLADDMADTQLQLEARLGLARALLHLDELERAQRVAEEARAYKYPLGYPGLLALCSIIALRRSETSRARDTFREAVTRADDLLEREARNLGALDAKALALCGLAISEDASLVAAAVEAYRAARAVNSDPGVITSVLQDLHALAPADPTRLLQRARAAAGAKA
jgi:tetratricopeptide (TPR) repeat protein